MLDVKKLIQSAIECLGWPYVSPGSNDSRGIDCSGLFVKCFRDQNGSIYHGSNTIYRKYCGEKGELKSESQLLPGMAVFKWNPNTPEKFDDDLGDFQHIGMVVNINPVEIVHASSVAGRVVKDTGMGKWKYWGKLKNVDYQERPDTPDTPDTTGQTAYITGDKVNFRSGPGTGYYRLLYLNKGATVEVLEDKDGWAKCRYGEEIGYVKDDYVSFVSPGEEGKDGKDGKEGKDGQEDTEGKDGEDEKPENKSIHIVSSGGKVNIRRGNGTEYSPITSVVPGATLPYIATAVNGWYAVRTGKQVGWVSPDYAYLEGND